ncbi:MAG: SprT family zinc-dependent metalloprotease [Opitutaceae bacterium]|nr:SprT family zinc-dependent metalloprotease [Opitutaceae bacterium]
MNENAQQTFLELFAPTPGVHLPSPRNSWANRVPPAPAPPPALEPNDAVNSRPQPPAHRAPSGHGGRGDVVFERSARARHYRLTLRRDGTAVATIPARGSEREAVRFVEQHREWLDRARERQRHRPRAAEVWTVGTHVLWRGEMHAVRIAAAGERPQVCLAADVFRVPRLDGDLRPTLEAHFARRARIELPARTWELSAITGVEVKHVTVRNQRSRWGSCSANGTISLNWRLVQTPEFVRDYIVYHELMHLREMNHSDRFWARVEEVCPGWREAERWIKRNGALVGL